MIDIAAALQQHWCPNYSADAIGWPAPIIVAEVGINHNGDIDLARRCIHMAAQAGADVVKFQNYRTEDFVSDRSLMITYRSKGKAVSEPQFDLFKRCELGRGDLAALKRECDRHDVVFASTPTSSEGVADLVDVGVRFLKNGSDYLGNLALIRCMGETGLPTVLSTGMATRDDVNDAVTAFRGTGNEKLILLHCTSLYPTPSEELNLRRMSALRAAFKCPVGFSDHSHGVTAAVGAVAMGACLIEKHFTLDRDLPGPDQEFSMNPDELKELVRQVRLVYRALGSAEIAPGTFEWQSRDQFLLSCVAAGPLPSRHVLHIDDIVFRRPGTGIRPGGADSLVGRTLRHAVQAGHVFSGEDFE